MNRCANCIAPHRDHFQRREAAPACPNGKGVYREMTDAEVTAAYRAEFGDGPPEPIATFKLSDPADMKRAKRVLGMDAMRGYFAPGGGGVAALAKAAEETR